MVGDGVVDGGGGEGVGGFGVFCGEYCEYDIEGGGGGGDYRRLGVD